MRLVIHSKDEHFQPEGAIVLPGIIRVSREMLKITSAELGAPSPFNVNWIMRFRSAAVVPLLARKIEEPVVTDALGVGVGVGPVDSVGVGVGVGVGSVDSVGVGAGDVDTGGRGAAEGIGPVEGSNPVSTAGPCALEDGLWLSEGPSDRWGPALGEPASSVAGPVVSSTSGR
jgi:hypothetical protein